MKEIFIILEVPIVLFLYIFVWPKKYLKLFEICTFLCRFKRIQTRKPSKQTGMNDNFCRYFPMIQTKISSKKLLHLVKALMYHNYVDMNTSLT